ncbi:PadR family transcriptional regulator [uncultured Cohaesibacter sp.]|uniref:PadR family transcriptional regulator n=1 Tax=uncultured Cohaesibacter sp. TaxID=1002546 RepID=UPI00292D2301|nr:PadR family transcriptional regulator [uncultured Cohaesibacter sp.]
MNVRSICLAVLFCSDRTGYDIRKISTEGIFSFFIEASYGSIYPALNKLEEEGLVTCRHEALEGKPARKIYSITDDGRAAFASELFLPHRQDIFRSEFLLIAIFSRLVGPDVISSAIHRQIEFSKQELDQISSCGDSDEDTCDGEWSQEMTDLDRQAAQWAQNYGLYCVQASIDYLNEHGGDLIEIARKGHVGFNKSSELQ